MHLAGLALITCCIDKSNQDQNYRFYGLIKQLPTNAIQLDMPCRPFRIWTKPCYRAIMLV